jgi:peptidoglycan-associated lipoprotein
MATLTRIRLLRAACTTMAASIIGACAAEPKHPATWNNARATEPSRPVSTPSTPNTPTASNVSISEDILRACHMSDADAYFPFDSSRVTASDRNPLDQVASCLTRGVLAGHKIKLVGRADPRGTDDYNMTLGQSRADSVASYLGRRGVGGGNASTTSRGAMDATGTDETGWSRDRRVDIVLAN